jgi:predicted nucleic acid-binding Zn ribbon protein
MIYPAHCDKCGDVEISKPMRDAFPTRHACGGKLARRFEAVPVHFAAGGFYTTDVNRMKSIVGADRYARFEHERDGAIKRAKAGKLTPYEKVLESV